MNNQTMTIEQFGATIKQKYPAYASYSDAEIGQKMLQKYPQYQSKISQPTQQQTQGGFNLSNEPFVINDVLQGASNSETNSGTGILGTLGNIGRNVFQSTVGSKGLAGVAQMPGRVLAQPGLISDTTSGFQQVGNIANQAGNLYMQANRTSDPVQKQKLLQQAQALQQSASQLDTSQKKLAENIFTPGEALGTAGNAALTAVTFGTQSLLASALETLLPSSKIASTVAQFARPLALGTSDVSKAAAITRLGVRTGESVLTSEAFNTANNLANGEKPFTNAGTAAIFGLAIPITGATANKILNESSSRLISASQRMYQSAMKPVGTAANKAEVVATGLREGIVLSNAGIEKTVSRIDSLEEQLGHAIDEAAKGGATISTSSLKPFVETAKSFFKNISDVAEGDQAIVDIDNIYSNFVKKYGDNLPVDVAQTIKTSTYAWLKKSYGKLASAVDEGNKQLVRGLKEGIADVAPIVKDVNPRLKSLYRFDEALERSVGRFANTNLLGLGTKILFAGGEAANKRTLSTVIALASHILGGLSNKSRIAIYVNRLGGLMDKMTPIQRSQIFVRIPALKNLYARISGVSGPADTIQKSSEQLRLAAPVLHQNAQGQGATLEYLKQLGL